MIELTIDGKKIPLNKYVREVFLRVITALVSTLKGYGEDWNEIKIVIKKNENRS